MKPLSFDKNVIRLCRSKRISSTSVTQFFFSECQGGMQLSYEENVRTDGIQ